MGFSQQPFAASYACTVWHVSDGLPEDTVQAIAETPDGNLWLGTTGGVVRFDGAHLQRQQFPATRPYGVISAFSLMADGDGDLWAGTEGGGLLSVSHGQASLFGPANGLTDSFVRATFRDAHHTLWVGTDDGLFQLKKGRFVRVDGNSNIPAMAVHSITDDAQHRVWIGGSALISIGRDGGVTKYSLPGAFGKSRVKNILQTKDGVIWVGTVGGLARLEGDRFRLVEGLHATVRSLMQSTDGTLWIGTIGNGLWTFREGRLNHVTEPGLLPSQTILALFQDDSGQVWIGTQAGLVRLNPTSVSLVSLPHSGDPDFETISGDAWGNLWVAAQSVFLLRGGNAQPLNFPGLNGVSVRSVYRARDGALWVGTDGSGAYRLFQNTTRHYSAPADLTNNFVRAFLESRSGDMWIATDEGVSAIGHGISRKYTQASGLVFFSTRCLLEDHHGTLWIGTDQGLSSWRNGVFENNVATRGLAREKVWSMLEDSNGVLWFGTREHGLFRYRDNTLQQITTDMGLPSNSVYQLLQDRGRQFWITGPNTIASIEGAQMDGDPPTAAKPLHPTAYGMPFGAENAQLYGGRQPAGYLAPDDSVWFPTTRGVAHIDGVASIAHGPPPRVEIQSLIEDGRSAEVHDAMEIPAGVTRLSLEYAATDLRPRNMLHFRYKLENLDHDWITAGPSDVATYTNLRGGQYRFLVQALEDGQSEAAGEAAITFIKKPYFYQAWWFYFLCGISLGAIGWTVYRLRLRQMRIRFAAVLEERNRLAREIHDTVIQGCTGLSAVLEAMAITSEDTETSGELLDYAREQMRSTINEARRAVWDMRYEKEEDSGLLDALQALAKQTTREHKEIAVSVEAPAWLRLRTSALHEVMMVMREAVSNAVQHSGTSSIDLAVHSDAETLTLTVRDFGKGITPIEVASPAPGHFGVRGMGERINRLGGTISFTVPSGGGTIVRLKVSASHSRKLEHSESA